jgi:uncharacterized metal-binding protein
MKIAVVSEFELERSENVIKVLFSFFIVGTLFWIPDLEIGSGTLERVSKFGWMGFFENITNVLFSFFFVKWAS